jgi:hypothetical protein
MPLSYGALSAFPDGNLVIGGATSTAVHSATFDEFLYLTSVNSRSYELPMTLHLKNGSNVANIVVYVIPDSREQLVCDGLPVWPGTSVSFSASSDVAVFGHVLRDI